MVHPQKRMDIKKALEAVIGRVLEVKEKLTDLNKKVSFINLDDVLVDLKLSPNVLEVPVSQSVLRNPNRMAWAHGAAALTGAGAALLHRGPGAGARGA